MGLERSSVGGAIDGVTEELVRQRLVPETAVILDWVRDLMGPVVVTDQASRPGSGWPGR